jgi:hypothetical protein
MINITVNLEERLVQTIDDVGKPLGLNREQVFKEALKARLAGKEFLIFEKQWIEAFKNNPDDESRAEDWLNAQS